MVPLADLPSASFKAKIAGGAPGDEHAAVGTRRIQPTARPPVRGTVRQINSVVPTRCTSDLPICRRDPPMTRRLPGPTDVARLRDTLAALPAFAVRHAADESLRPPQQAFWPGSRLQT